MKIAMSSYSGMGAWWVLRLMAEGHDVDYYLSEPEFEDILSGIIRKPKLPDIDQRRHRQGYGFPDYTRYDLSLFDTTGRPRWAEHSRAQTPTYGDGELHSVLESNREVGIQIMEEVGINVPAYQRFDSIAKAKDFIKREGKRYVYKPFTTGKEEQDKATTYVAKDAEDLLEFIDELYALSQRAPFILQEFETGTEIGIAGFFDGAEFHLLTATLEEKKFMNDNKGPNTGCSGNLVFTLSPKAKIFKEGLEKAAPFLAANNFRGIIDLNTIVTSSKVYGLEWTPRFGYMSDPTIATMYGEGFADVLYSIAVGKRPMAKWENSFGASTTFTIPPYPTEIRIAKAKDIPIEGIDPKNIDQLCSYYLYDVMIDPKSRGKKLITSGNLGYIGATLAAASSAKAAFAKDRNMLESLQIPNMQYRTDIEKFTEKRYDTLTEQGWLDTDY